MYLLSRRQIVLPSILIINESGILAANEVTDSTKPLTEIHLLVMAAFVLLGGHISTCLAA